MLGSTYLFIDFYTGDRNARKKHIPVVTSLNELGIVFVQNDLDSLGTLASPVNYGADGRKWQTEVTEKAGKHRQVCCLEGLINLKSGSDN